MILSKLVTLSPNRKKKKNPNNKEKQKKERKKENKGTNKQKGNKDPVRKWPKI